MSYVDGTRRRPCVARVGWSIQEEEQEGGPHVNGGVLGLLVQTCTGTAGGGARSILS